MTTVKELFTSPEQEARRSGRKRTKVDRFEPTESDLEDEKYGSDDEPMETSEDDSDELDSDDILETDESGDDDTSGDDDKSSEPDDAEQVESEGEQVESDVEQVESDEDPPCVPLATQHSVPAIKHESKSAKSPPEPAQPKRTNGFQFVPVQFRRLFLAKNKIEATKQQIVEPVPSVVDEIDQFSEEEA